MTTAVHETHGAEHPDTPFRHEAFFYTDNDCFLDGTLDFIRGGIEAHERTLVVVNSDKIALLRGELGAVADEVWFADMTSVGMNPARIIPAWRDFVSSRRERGRRFRGVGEPIWDGRSPAELVECQRHERLLNLAFPVGTPFWLLCPYDIDALNADVIAEAERTHPYLRDGTANGPRRSTSYAGTSTFMAPFDDPLPAPPPAVATLPFDDGLLSDVRRFVTERAVAAGLTSAQVADLVLAVNELATNSIRYGGGGGMLRMWEEAAAVICEIADAGYIDEPLVGRVRPTTDRTGGRGLWLVNQLCDLVQLRSSDTGTVVRLHMRRP